jgi:hypothetical protein
MTSRKLLASFVAFMLLASGSPAADVKELKPDNFKVPNHGDLQLTLPEGWTKKVEESRAPGMPPTIVLSPKAAAGKRADCEMLITPMSGRDPKFNSPESLKKLAELRGKQMVRTSKEQKLELQELKGTAATGYYFTFTDKAPGPGEFECMTAGFVGLGDLFLNVTILHHQKDAPERDVALDVLKGATQAPKAGAPAKAEKDKANGLRVSVPGAKWEMVLGGGLRVLDDQSDERRKIRQVSAMSEESGLVVSIFMEPAGARGDSTAVRNVYWGRAKNSPIPKKDIKLGKAGQYATVEYVVPDIDQKNMNVYIAHEGTWIDVHLSKTTFTAADQKTFDELVKSIDFEAAGPK